MRSVCDYLLLLRWAPNEHAVENRVQVSVGADVGNSGNLAAAARSNSREKPNRYKIVKLEGQIEVTCFLENIFKI